MKQWFELASDKQGYFISCLGTTLVIISWVRFLSARNKINASFPEAAQAVKELGAAGLLSCTVFTCFVIVFWLHVLHVLHFK